MKPSKHQKSKHRRQDLSRLHTSNFSLISVIDNFHLLMFKPVTHEQVFFDKF